VTVPKPLACDSQVTFDPATRSLLVKASGVGAIYWRRGHAKLVAAGESGSYYEATPTVWAHAPGRRDIARGEAVRDGWLRFKVDDATYRQLAGSDLSAIVTVDREAGQILGVRFKRRNRS
jgi:hypothetical protein